MRKYRDFESKNNLNQIVKPSVTECLITKDTDQYSVVPNYRSIIQVPPPGAQTNYMLSSAPEQCLSLLLFLKLKYLLVYVFFK